MSEMKIKCDYHNTPEVDLAEVENWRKFAGAEY